MLSLISEVLRLPLANRSLSRLATDSSPALGCRGDSFSPEEKTKHQSAGHVCRNADIILPVELNIAKVTALLKRKKATSYLPFPFFFDADIFTMLRCQTRTRKQNMRNHVKTLEQASAPGLCSSAIVRAQALPNTTRSSRELAPSRLAPWTLAQAASPQAYSPGTTLSAPLA